MRFYPHTYLYEKLICILLNTLSQRYQSLYWTITQPYPPKALSDDF